MCSNASAAPRQPIRTAFSLLEVMVVLVIIGLILGIVTVNVMGQLKGAKHDTAVAQMGTIVNALQMYSLEHGRYPTNEEGLNVLTVKSRKTGEPLMTSVPNDPWRRPYIYNSPGLGGQPYEVISYGADGQEGGEGADADIVSWELTMKGDLGAN